MQNIKDNVIHFLLPGRRGKLKEMEMVFYLLYLVSIYESLHCLVNASALPLQRPAMPIRLCSSQWLEMREG